jgi:hypothetical protein
MRSEASLRVLDNPGLGSLKTWGGSQWCVGVLLARGVLLFGGVLDLDFSAGRKERVGILSAFSRRVGVRLRGFGMSTLGCAGVVPL